MNTSIAWRPSASLENLRQRAALMSNIRTFFTERGYLEVETPVMGRFGVTDVYLATMRAMCRGESYCLQTSPEYHMKRLLASGSGPIFQLARVFRDDELGRWHNPEFTLLEWYQLGVDHHVMMKEVDLFLQQMLGCGSLVKKTYQQAFLDVCQLDPLTASLTTLQDALVRFNLQGVLPDEETDRDQYLFLLMSHVVEPAFAHEKTPIGIYDFPSSQAALAQIQEGVAARFEVYYQGVELANGFYELTDAHLQQMRFEHDVALRQAKGLPVYDIDPFFLAALNHGLPACSGVALGVDRLLALALQQRDIASVMAFDFSIA